MWIPPMCAVVRGLTEVWLTPARRDVDPSHVCGSAGLTEVGLTPTRRDVDPSYMW